MAIRALTSNADPALFREMIPYSEIRCILNSYVDYFKSIINNPAWVTTGDLQKVDIAVLDSVVAVFYRHVVPVALAFECDFFPTIMQSA